MLQIAAALLSGLARRAQGAGATEGITGQLIDIGLYAADYPASEYTGVHARACALEGFEVGLLTRDGKVYHVGGDLAANNNAKLLQFMMAPGVTVSGEITEKDGQMTIAGSGVKVSGSGTI